MISILFTISQAKKQKLPYPTLSVGCLCKSGEIFICTEHFVQLLKTLDNNPLCAYCGNQGTCSKIQLEKNTSR